MPGQEQDGDDLSLLRRARTGDRDAFGTLVERHAPSVHRFARALTRTPEQAEDVMQQAFLNAWKGVQEEGAAADSLRGWLFTITRHAAGRLARRRAGEPEHAESLEDLGERAGFGGDDPEQVAMVLQEGRRLHAALDTLPEDDRAVITLRDLEGLSGEEAARVLGLPLAAMKTRLHRARLKLRAAVLEEARHEA